jgi:hypothetical protein
MFINHADYTALECLSCRIAWKEYPDGSWRLITGQDGYTLEVETSDSLVVWEEREEA